MAVAEDRAAATKIATGKYSTAVPAADAHVMTTLPRGFMSIGLDSFVAGETTSGLAAPCVSNRPGRSSAAWGISSH